MSQTNTPKAVEGCHKLLLRLIPKLNQFPRAHRFTSSDNKGIPVLIKLFPPAAGGLQWAGIQFFGEF